MCCRPCTEWPTQLSRLAGTTNQISLIPCSALQLSLSEAWQAHFDSHHSIAKTHLQNTKVSRSVVRFSWLRAKLTGQRAPSPSPSLTLSHSPSLPPSPSPCTWAHIGDRSKGWLGHGQWLPESGTGPVG